MSDDNPAFPFPNNSKRGEFKKIVIASIILIKQKGLRKYILAVKDKIRRKEFKVFDEMDDPTRIWSEFNLQENYWKVVGPNSKEEYESGANSSFTRLKEMGVQPESKILDVGCGTGRITSKLIDYLSDEGLYYGTDITPEPINFCKQRYLRKNFKFIQNTWETIPIKNQKFDFIIFHSVFTHIYPDEIQTYLKECTRFLQKTSMILADIFITVKTKDHLGDRGKIEYNEQYFINLVKNNNLKICEVLPRHSDDRVLYKISL